MVKRIFVMVVIFGISFFSACKKKEEQPAQRAPIAVAPGEMKIIVPEIVKGKWDGVRLLLEDKITKRTSEITVKLNSEYNIPNSNLKIKVGEFLPDFKMYGLTITSSSNEPNNPAVRVIVYENGKEIFKGWLYSKFPAIHPFQHERFRLTLKEGIRAPQI